MQWGNQGITMTEVGFSDGVAKLLRVARAMACCIAAFATEGLFIRIRMQLVWFGAERGIVASFMSACRMCPESSFSAALCVAGVSLSF
jgi:hypothetical protein